MLTRSNAVVPRLAPPILQSGSLGNPIVSPNDLEGVPFRHREHQRPPQITFSIIMCFRNAASFLKQAIDSVFAQTFANWELILIDDASDDSSSEICKPYLNDPRIRSVRRTTRHGIGINKTLAIQMSTGEYVAIVDGDDAIFPHALARVLAAYKEDQRRELVYSTYCEMATGRVACWVGPYPESGSMAEGTDVVSHLLTFRRRAFIRADATTDFPYAWDKRLVAGLEEVSYPHFIPEPLYLYRNPRTSDYARESSNYHEQIKQWAVGRESGVSIVIPYHNRCDQLSRTLESLRAAINRTRLPHEIILSCWNDDPVIPPWVRKLHSIQGEGFSRGRMCNLGARFARFRKLFFLDADVMVPVTFMDELSSRVAYRRVWLPICRDECFQRQGCDEHGWRVYGYGLLGIMKRDLWWAGGWEEWESWGGEDDVMLGKLELNCYELNRERLVGFVHQDHPFIGIDDEESRQQRRIRIKDAVEAFRRLSSVSSP